MSVDINNSMLTEKALDYAKLSDLAYATWKYEEKEKGSSLLLALAR